MLLDETHISSGKFRPEPIDGLFSGNWMHYAGAKFLQAPLTFDCPESMNHPVLCRIEALHKSISQQCSRLAWKRERRICNFFHS